jgi:transposase
MKKKHSPKMTQDNSKDLRQRVIRRKDNNLSGSKIAAMLLIAVITVYNWLKLFKEKATWDLPSQKRGRKVGNGRLPSHDQKENIQTNSTNFLPERFGITSSTWSRAEVFALVEKEYGIKIAVPCDGRLLKTLLIYFPKNRQMTKRISKLQCNQYKKILKAPWKIKNIFDNKNIFYASQKNEK